MRMLKDNKRRKLVKQKFGKTVLDEHKRCGEIIGDFVHLANKSGWLRIMISTLREQFFF